nr:MAG TPA: transposase [Caudoviricetes sp.]
MERVNGVLCATKSELVGAALITERYLKELVNRKTLQIVVRGCRGRQAQYAVDTLPEKYKAEVYKRFDIPPMDRVKSLLEQLIRPLPEAVSYYHAYRLPDGRCLPADKIAQYVAEAQILEAISAYWMEHTSKRGKASRRPMGKGEFYGWMTDMIQALPQEEYPHKLPKSRLREKHEAYQRDGYESLIHKGYQNQNASKTGGDEQSALLLMLLASPNNLNNSQVARLYNETAKVRGWEKLTASAVGKIAKSKSLLIDAGRKGRTDYRLQVQTAIKRTKPTRAMSYWVHDGWTVELYYQHTTTDKKGGTKTVYDCRLVVVVILDASCSYPIGYAIGERECPQLIAQALRSAAHHTEELFGVKCHPREIQYDHYQIGALTPLYKAMSNKLSPARAKNARAKIIEPYFSRLNKTYCQLQPNWSGYGITGKKGKGTNREVASDLRHQIPTRAEVEGQIHTIMSQERALKHEEYMSLFDGDVTDIQLDRSIYLEHWGETSGRYIGQSIYGLTPTIFGEVQYYESFEQGFKEQRHQRWQVFYDPSDLASVLAVSEDGQYKYLLERKHLQPMAVEDQRPEDLQHLDRVRTHQREIEDWVDGEWKRMMPLALEASKDNSVAQELLQRSITPFRRGKKRPIEDDTPAEAEAFAREMDDLLPDSQGQVKDNRYDRKLQREGAEDNDNGPAPQPKKRSILERV